MRSFADLRSVCIASSAVALLILSSACSSGGGQPGAGAGAAAGTGGGQGIGGGSGSGPSQPPGEIVGSWYAGSGYTSVPYDPGTGSWGMPSGKGLVYVFAADGSYTKGFQSYESSGGCTTGFTAFEQGYADVTVDSLATYPSSGHLTFTDTCAPSLSSDDPIQDLAVEEFSWQLRPSDYDPAETVLFLRRSDGAEATFSRL